MMKRKRQLPFVSAWLLTLCVISCSAGNRTSDDVNPSKLNQPIKTMHVMDMSRESNDSTPMDPAVMKVLSQVLDTLESIRDARVKDLDQVSKGLQNLADDQKGKPDELGPGKQKPIIRKTYGYKVTVYATPTNETKPSRYGDEEEEDLHPAASSTEDLKSEPSHGVVSAYGGLRPKGASSRNHGGTHHKHRDDEESRGYKRGLRQKVSGLKKHEDDSYKHVEGGHKRDASDTGHSKGVYGHDKGGANEKGLKEKTQIEYFEREQAKDEEVIKKDSESTGNKHNHGRNRGGHYEEGHHPHGGYGGAERGHQDREDGYGEEGHHSDKGGHLKKKKGEGLKERGFRITVEREVYLRDGYHDKGYEAHDKAHHKELAENSRHKSNTGDKHKRVLKEDKEVEKTESDYNTKKTHDSEGHVHHDASKKVARSRDNPHGHVTYLVGHGDQHYSPSNAEPKHNETYRSQKPVIEPEPPKRQHYNNRRPGPRTVYNSRDGGNHKSYRQESNPNLQLRIRNDTVSYPELIDGIQPPISERERFAFRVPNTEVHQPAPEIPQPQQLPNRPRIGPFSINYNSYQSQDPNGQGGNVQTVPVIPIYLQPEQEDSKENVRWNIQRFPNNNVRDYNAALLNNGQINLQVPQQAYQNGAIYAQSPSASLLNQGPGVWYAPGTKK